MERLTFEGSFCDIAQCFEVRGGSFCESGYCSQREVWERLKEYEDTGLTPEQCAELVKAGKNAPVSEAAPVVHTDWAKIKLGRRGCYIFRCPACNACSPYVSKFCPNCGAKMDGGKQDG